MPVIFSRREFATGLTAVLAAATLPIPLASPASASVQTGVPAPDFTAADSQGKQHTLSAYRNKVVVLEWTNHECPYTEKHYVTGNMQTLQRTATDAGVIWLSVVSSRPGAQGHVEGLEADRLTEQRNARPTAVILDPRGSVGRLYGARTTPHMFVINPEGVLVYMGGIDDQPSANPATVKNARNYVREALDALAAGRPIAVSAARPYGCSVKY